MEVNFDYITTTTEAKLNELNYSADTIRHYRDAWSKFRSYLQKNELSILSSQTLNAFFLETFKTEYKPYGSMPTEYCRTVRRALQILVEYNTHGTILRRIPTKEHVWPKEYAESAEKFMTTMAETQSRKTLRQYRFRLELFLDFLIKMDCHDYNSLKPEIIKAFLLTRAELEKTTRAYDSYFLRKYFDFLYENEFSVVDYSVFVPNVKGNKQGKIPSFYTCGEITRLLESVDRSNPTGKRDYAILLLAVRYGMRADDIRSLELSSFDWDNNKFSFIQKKSPKRVEFPLLSDVQLAILDYFKNGRPDKTLTKSRNVFVRHNAPYDAFGQDNNLHSIVSKYMKRSGIDMQNYRKHGLHSLRHAIAGNLLEQGVPIATIAEILSHSSTETTRIYTKIGLGELETCAVEVEV